MRSLQIFISKFPQLNCHFFAAEFYDYNYRSGDNKISFQGLRMAGLIGCIGTCIGTGIKVFSIRSDLFFIVMIGQAITSASQLVIVCLPPKLASVWFKPNEVIDKFFLNNRLNYFFLSLFVAVYCLFFGNIRYTIWKCVGIYITTINGQG